MYHRFTEGEKKGFCSSKSFLRQVRYIKQNYRPVTLSELATCIREQRPIPPNTVVITIDDGYQDFYQFAYPILREEGIPATFFVATGFVNRDLWLWTDKVEWLLREQFRLPEGRQVSGFTIESGVYDEQRRSALGKALLTHLLSISDNEKNQCITALSQMISRPLPTEAPTDFSAVTWKHLREMQENGIEIGGHTVTHPSLGQVDYAQAEGEILGCMRNLKENLGEGPRTFCYPNGMPSDFQSFLPGLVAKAGFVGACVAFPDSHGCHNRFAIRRHSSGENWFQFEKAISGMEFLGHRLRGTDRQVG